MSKEYIEAFERMTEHLDLEDEYSYNQERKDEEIIKKSLQRLESIDNANPNEAMKSLEKIKDNFGCDLAYYNLSLEYEIVEQALLKAQEQVKVLSILKEKCVSVWYLMKSKTVEEYNSYLYIKVIEDTKNFILTQEEYDLLREVLG